MLSLARCLVAPGRICNQKLCYLSSQKVAVKRLSGVTSALGLSLLMMDSILLRVLRLAITLVAGLPQQTCASATSMTTKLSLKQSGPGQRGWSRPVGISLIAERPSTDKYFHRESATRDFRDPMLPSLT